MKKVKKIFKVLFLIFLVIAGLSLTCSITYYKITTNGLSLDKNKLQISNPTKVLKILDINAKEIKPTSVSYVKLSKLSTNTKNAFICAEDKRFYKHNGLDFTRIGGAILSNIKSKSFSQGASTISQQLVKNTQLTNEKTIKRKLQEVKLTKELEKNYTKDEILELYLNNIYFGNGCYGIENASKHYFNKSASELSLSESTMLASTINAPSVYDIENNLEKVIKRRNLILELMKSYNKITQTEYEQAKIDIPQLNISEISGNSNLFKNIVKEACNLLGISEYKLTNSNYKIQTNINNELCSQINKIASNYSQDYKNATMVIDNKTHNIVAVDDKFSILNNTWQPGSLIKPILVYAPAIEKGIISPATKILDNKINIAGYSPENADKNYHGYISCKTALSKSYNIPAVKLLNELGVEEAKLFANKLGIEFSKTDNHLALALGGFEKGVTPKSLCDAYSTFACNGNFQTSTYIDKITKNGKVVFEKEQIQNQVMKDSTAFLINDMLKECAKTGTAKKLNSLDFEVCAKTGTVGKSSSNKNQLAFNIAYTTNHTILTIIHGKNLPTIINGATHPTLINKEILTKLYEKQKPANFKQPNTVTMVSLDKESYNKNKLIQSENENSLKEYFDNKNTPNTQDNNFTLNAINSMNHKPILCFTLNKNYDYFLIRSQKNREEIIFSSLDNNENFIKFCDKSAKNNEIYTYKLKICEKNKNEEFFSNSTKLKAY